MAPPRRNNGNRGRRPPQRGRARNSSGADGDGGERNDLTNPDRSRSPIGGEEDRSPSATPATPPVPPPATHSQPVFGSSSGFGPSNPPSAIRSFVDDFWTLGTRGKRLFIRIFLEGLAEYARERPEPTNSRNYDRFADEVANWMRKSDAEKRDEIRPWVNQWLEHVRARSNRFRGAIGIVYDIAREWLTTQESLRVEFLNCFTDGPNQLAQVFMDLPPAIKNLLRRL